MACWCEQTLTKGPPYEAEIRYPGGETITATDPNFCVSCNRDLRLPVARKYKKELPASAKTDEWWFCFFHVDDDAFAYLHQIELRDGDWYDDYGRKIEERYRMFYGPVTVSPEVPE